MSITFTDIFCGAGGSSIGLVSAGFELKLAANHWDRAIETHSSNFDPEQTAQAGNAVSSNVACWLAHAVAEVL